MFFRHDSGMTLEAKGDMGCTFSHLFIARSARMAARCWNLVLTYVATVCNDVAKTIKPYGREKRHARILQMAPNSAVASSSAQSGVTRSVIVS